MLSFASHYCINNTPSDLSNCSFPNNPYSHTTQILFAMQVFILLALLFKTLLCPTQRPGSPADSDASCLNLCRLTTLDFLRTLTIYNRRNHIKLLEKSTSTGRQSNSDLKWIILLLLMLSGDVHPHPGPVTTNPKCGSCKKTVSGAQLSLRCGLCKITFHRTCANLSLKEYRKNILTASPWHCNQCLNSTAYPCGVCGYNVREDQLSILCSYCDSWIHQECTGLSVPELMRYDGPNTYYPCPNCVLPFNNTNISLGASYLVDSDTDSVYSGNDFNSSSHSSSPDEPLCAFINKSHPKNFKIAHLNINSFKNKFYDCGDILHSGVFDIIAFSETKLGPSFYTPQFMVPGYKRPIRVDKSTQSEGLLLYFKDSLNVIEREYLKFKSFQSIICDVQISKNRTWCIILVYRPPKSSKDGFYIELQNVLDRVYTKYENVLLMGDININTKDLAQSQDYSNLLSAFGMEHLYTEPTCFKNINNPTHIDQS